MELIEICENLSDLIFEEVIKECENLRKYAVQSRYPYNFGIEEEDVKQALQDAVKIRDFVTVKIFGEK